MSCNKIFTSRRKNRTRHKKIGAILTEAFNGKPPPFESGPEDESDDEVTSGADVSDREVDTCTYLFLGKSFIFNSLPHSPEFEHSKKDSHLKTLAFSPFHANDKILDWSKLKAFADDKIRIT